MVGLGFPPKSTESPSLTHERVSGVSERNGDISTVKDGFFQRPCHFAVLKLGPAEVQAAASKELRT